MFKKNKNQNSANYHHMYSLCDKHMNQYVLVETVDGQYIDGIVTGVDGDYVYLAIPLTEEEQKVQGNQESSQPNYFEPPNPQARQYGGYGYPYSYGTPYSYGYSPPARFRRLILPLAALVAISALPWY